MLEQPVAADEDGAIRTTGGDVVGGQTIPLANVEAVNPRYDRWTGSVSAGGIVTRGNSETRTVTAAVAAVRRGPRDRFSVAAEYFYANQDSDDGEEETTGDAWRVRGQYDYFVTERLYPYARMYVERDRPAEVLLRMIPGAGVWEGLFSELKAEWRHDQTPAPDAERNDYRYLVNVGWAFE